MRLIGELFCTFFLVKLRSWQEEKKVKKFYSTSPLFYRLEKALKRAYFLQNPYQISRKFLTAKKEQDLHVYGETPLSSLEIIAKKCNLSSEDHLIDLGCGRGRALFFLTSHFGCTAVGIDWIPTFIEKAKNIAEKRGEKRISFRCQDLSECDLTDATVVYLAGTCMQEKEIKAIIQATEKLKKGAKVISVSFQLEAAHLKLEEQFEVPFLWGPATIFLHSRS